MSCYFLIGGARLSYLFEEKGKTVSANQTVKKGTISESAQENHSTNTWRMNKLEKDLRKISLYTDMLDIILQQVTIILMFYCMSYVFSFI